MSRHGDRRRQLRRRAWGGLVLTFTAVILVCAAASMLPLRWDLSEDRMFTLSPATRDLLTQLDDPIMIRAYVSPDLPQPYARLQRFLADMLRLYHEAGGGKVDYAIVNPEADANTTAALAAMGVPRVQVQVVENDRAEIKQGYLAVVIEYLDKKEVIPVVQGEAGFEYLLTRRIKRLTGKGRKKLGLVGDAGAGAALHLGRLRQLLGDDYEVVDVHPAVEPVPADVRVLIVPGLAKAADAKLRYRLDQFRMRGGGLLVLAGNADADLTSGVDVRPVAAKTHAWLADLGLSIEPGLVMDEMAARISVDQRQGMFTFRSVVDYPFVVLVRNVNKEHIITRDLEAVRIPFASPLAFAGAKGAMLLATSMKAAVQNGPPFDVDPLTSLDAHMRGLHRDRYMLAAVLTGAADSAFNTPPAGVDKAGQRMHTEDQRVIAIASRALIDDAFLEGENLNFLLNCVDWLARDEALIALRSKGVTQRPLPPLSATAKAAWKGIWLFALPLCIIAFGLWRWRYLHRRQV